MIDFDDWCYLAVAEIRFKPDREMVFAELKAHLEDHYDDLIAQGHPSEIAKRLALEAMGDPEEIAPQLGQIHKPWLGYVYSITKISAIISCFLALFLIVVLSVSHFHAVVSVANYKSLALTGADRFYAEPRVSDTSDGYRFTITEAAINSKGDTLYLELQSVYWPWMKEPTIIDHFWAVDSLGNRYLSRHEAQYDDVPKVKPSGGFYSTCISTDQLKIIHFDSRAEWVELRYDRDGREIILRIDLSGGDRE